MDHKILTDIFRQTCLNHYFELGVVAALQDKMITIPTYLSVGGEHISSSVEAATGRDCLVFGQHRCHSWALSYGCSPTLLAKELLGHTDGIGGGKQGSASIGFKPNFFGHSGWLGDNIPIACGAALASGKTTVAIGGDGAWEEDVALSTLGYAVHTKAPVLFICEDNDLSIKTIKSVRRCWSIVDVAKGFGMEAYDLQDDPESIYTTVKISLSKLPVLININYQRHLWHCNYGIDAPPKYNMFDIFKNKMQSICDSSTIILESRKKMEMIWEEAKK